MGHVPSYMSFLRRQSLLRRYDTELLHGSYGHVVRDDEVEARGGGDHAENEWEDKQQSWMIVDVFNFII